MKYLVVKHNTYYSISEYNVYTTRKDGTIYMTINVTATNDVKKLEKPMRMLKFSITFDCKTLALDTEVDHVYKFTNIGDILVKSNDSNIKPRTISKSKIRFIEIDNSKVTLNWSGILDLKACPNYNDNVEFSMSFSAFIKERPDA